MSESLLPTWKLSIRKSRATRWDYFLENPQGGGSGSSSYTSQKAAIAAATTRMNFQGAPVRVVIQHWDAMIADYVTTKTYWFEG